MSLSSSTDVIVEIDGRGVARVTLNRPHVRNAWSMELVDSLTHVFEALSARAGVRAAILTGAGDVFCAGGDLNWMRGLLDCPPQARSADTQRLMKLLETLDGFPHPLISRVNGAAFGGGFGMICTSDIAIASTNARFSLSEVRIGIVPGVISPFVSRRLSPGAIRAHCLTGQPIAPDTALHIGLIHQLVPPDALDAAVDGVIESVLASAPGAVAQAKALFRNIAASPDDARERAIASIEYAWEQPEAREGISAFLEKRRPTWSVT